MLDQGLSIWGRLIVWGDQGPIIAVEIVRVSMDISIDMCPFYRVSFLLLCESRCSRKSTINNVNNAAFEPSHWLW